MSVVSDRKTLAELAGEYERSRADQDGAQQDLGAELAKGHGPGFGAAVDQLLRFHAATVKANDAFVRYTQALDRERQEEMRREAKDAKDHDRAAAKRSEAETRSIKRATWAMVVVVFVQTVIALLQHR